MIGKNGVVGIPFTGYIIGIQEQIKIRINKINMKDLSGFIVHVFSFKNSWMPHMEIIIGNGYSMNKYLERVPGESQ